MRWPSKRLGTFWRPATTRTTNYVELFSPEREQNMAFWGATVFFAAVGPCRVMSLEKKKVSLKKTSKISKKSSPRASDTGKGSYKHNAPDLWDRGSMYFSFHQLQYYNITCVLDYKPLLYKGRCTVITVYSYKPILLCRALLKMFLFCFCLVSLHGD